MKVTIIVTFFFYVLCQMTLVKNFSRLYYLFLLSKSCFLYLFELMFPIFTLLIFVTSGDSSGISVTGETPQERGFRDEEAHRTPHGKRSARNENQRGSRQEFFSFINIDKRTLLHFSKSVLSST